MENKKLILVAAAAGAEGSSVARALRASGKYEVREGDITDIKGCYGVFAFVNSIDEMELLKAAQASGIQHLVLQVNSNRTYTNIPGIPASFVRVPFYYESFFETNTIPYSNAKLAAASVEDLGPIVTTMFDHPEAYIGRTVNVIGTDATSDEYAALVQKLLGIKMESGQPVQQVIANRQLDLIESYGLNPGMQTFESWLQKNKAALLAEVLA